MIRLTKINGEEILINEKMVEYIEIIPESKIIMLNGKYHIVKESAQEIIRKTIEYNAEILTSANIDIKDRTRY